MTTMSSGGLLSAEQRRQTEEDGYFVLEGLLSLQECQTFSERLDEYVHGRRAPSQGLTLQREPRVQRGELNAARGDDVRKISGVAHGDDLFRTLVSHPTIVRIMQDLMGPNLKLFRSDVMMKPAEVGSAKGMHQDSPYWPIEPMALWSCWLPFDHATLDNGCMMVLPGSHKGGALPHINVTDDYIVPADRYDMARVVPLPMAPGSALFFHSLLLHGTAANRSHRPRRAAIMAYMAAEYRYTGTPPKPNYLLISGRDVPAGV